MHSVRIRWADCAAIAMIGEFAFLLQIFGFWRCLNFITCRSTRSIFELFRPPYPLAAKSNRDHRYPTARHTHTVQFMFTYTGRVSRPESSTMRKRDELRELRRTAHHEAG